MKASKKIIICSITLLVLVPLTVFAATGSFSLPFGGQTHTSNDVKLVYDYPVVEFFNHNLSVDGELAASVMKKGIFGYTLKERQEKWVTNKPYVGYSYGKHLSGTYHAVFVVNHMNGTGYVAGEYNLTSAKV